MDIRNGRTRESLRLGVLFLEAVARNGRSPLPKGMLDLYLRAGGTDTGRALRGCLRRVSAHGGREGRAAEYVVVEERLDELRRALREG